MGKDKEKKKKDEENIKKLMELLQEPCNQRCADCGERNPRWASITIGCFLCIQCGGHHRKLGTQISKIKSVTLDSWTDEAIDKMRQWGNDRVNAVYCPDVAKHPPPIHNDKDMEAYIKMKYERMVFGNGAARPLVTADVETFSGQLRTLASMGFTQEKRNIKALKKAGGNLDAAVEMLVNDPTIDNSDNGLTSSASYNNNLWGAAAAGRPSTGGGMARPSAYLREQLVINGVIPPSAINKAANIPNEYPGLCSQLVAMGFEDVEQNKLALHKTKGDVDQALNLLMKLKPSSPTRTTTNTTSNNNTIATPARSSSLPQQNVSSSSSPVNSRGQLPPPTQTADLLGDLDFFSSPAPPAVQQQQQQPYPQFQQQQQSLHAAMAPALNAFQLNPPPSNPNSTGSAQDRRHRTSQSLPQQQPQYQQQGIMPDRFGGGGSNPFGQQQQSVQPAPPSALTQTTAMNPFGGANNIGGFTQQQQQQQPQQQQFNPFAGAQQQQQQQQQQPFATTNTAPAFKQQANDLDGLFDAAPPPPQQHFQQPQQQQQQARDSAVSKKDAILSLFNTPPPPPPPQQYIGFNNNNTAINMMNNNAFQQQQQPSFGFNNTGIGMSSNNTFNQQQQHQQTFGLNQGIMKHHQPPQQQLIQQMGSGVGMGNNNPGGFTAQAQQQQSNPFSGFGNIQGFGQQQQQQPQRPPQPQSNSNNPFGF